MDFVNPQMFVSAASELHFIEVNHKTGLCICVLIHHAAIPAVVEDLSHTTIQLHQLTLSTWGTTDTSDLTFFVFVLFSGT